MAKVLIPLDRAHRLLTPGPVALVTTQRKGRLNVAPIAWTCFSGSRPPLVSISIYEGHFTNELIKASEQFVLNIPGLELLKQVNYCGSVSGRDVDKLQATGLHEGQPTKIEAPYLDECLAHLECVVVAIAQPGDHTVYVAEVVAAKAEEEAFSDGWLLTVPELKPLHHLGGRRYATLGDVLEAPDPEQDPENG